MDELVFVQLAKSSVVQYVNEHLDKSDGDEITINDVYVVWMCKTLQNNKALLSTTLSDGMYYEVTYNGDKNEVYFDAYKKWENKCIKLDTPDSEADVLASDEDVLSGYEEDDEEDPLDWLNW